MFSAGRVSTRIVAAAMILAGSLAFAQGVPTLVTELRDSSTMPAVLSIQIPDQAIVALAQWAKIGAVKVQYRISDSEPLKDYGILPFAEVRMFLNINAKSGTFKELNNFSASKSALVVTVRMPEDDQTIWFRDAKDPKIWYPVEALGDGKHGFLLKAEPENPDNHTITIFVTFWPLGDPLMGWGPKAY